MSTLPLLLWAVLQQAPLADLPAGPHPVGFRTTWQLDSGRTYRYPRATGELWGADGDAPRPILVNAWYPAERTEAGADMVHADYFEIVPEDLELVPLADALVEHAHGIFVSEVVGAAESDLDQAGRERLAAVLAAPAGARRDAPPAPGPFPVVLYHSGAGSSFEDNALFCAYLASHGYVVLGSAYPRADGTSLNIDGGDGSGDDLEFLTRHAAALRQADARRLALVGHSAGAQAVLRHAARPGSRTTAVVLLDTTVDYYGLAMPLHAQLIEEILERPEELTEPLFVAAGAEASFQLCDRLEHAPRLYWTTPSLGHNEFIHQGIQTRHGQTNAEAQAARDTYRSLCAHVLAFLDAHLRDERAPLEGRSARAEATPLGGAEPHVEFVPVGATGPAPYQLDATSPPTPRQIPKLLQAHGVETTIEVLERFVGSGSPYERSTMLLGSLVWELVEAGDVEGARRLQVSSEAYLPGLTGLFTFLAEFGERAGREEQTRRARAVLEALGGE